MALEPLRTYRSFSRGVDVVAIIFWTFWLMVFTTWSKSFSYSITFLPLLLIFGASRWGFFEGAAWLLLIAWIFASFSWMTSGIIWFSSMAGFLIVKVFVLRFSIARGFQLASAIFIVSLVFYLLQMWMMKSLFPESSFSWVLLGRIFLSSAIEAVFGFVAAPFILSFSQAR